MLPINDNVDFNCEPVKKSALDRAREGMVGSAASVQGTAKPPTPTVDQQPTTRAFMEWYWCLSHGVEGRADRVTQSGCVAVSIKGATGKVGLRKFFPPFALSSFLRCRAVFKLFCHVLCRETSKTSLSMCQNLKSNGVKDADTSQAPLL